MRYWEVWVPRRKNYFRDPHNKQIEKDIKSLFETQKKIWAFLGEVFEDPNVESFLDTFKQHFSNNLNPTIDYYPVNVYIRAEPKHTLIQIAIEQTKQAGSVLNQSAPHLKNAEQEEIYLGFTNLDDAEDFANNIYWAFHGPDYQVIIYK